MQKESIQHNADIVLRSSDGVTFHCWRALLSISSSIFSDMFSLPQPDTSYNADELPIVDLVEDGRTLHLIVSLCHPPSFTGKLFEPDSIRELEAVLEAAKKYEMEDLRSAALLKLSDPYLVRQDPLRMYGLACLYQCRDAAKLAAQHTLVLPTLMRPGYVPDWALDRLTWYRDACAKAACALADDHRWIGYIRFSDLFGHGRARTTVSWIKCPLHSSGFETVNAYGWWMEYMKKSGQALRESPRGNTVKNKGLVDDVFAAILSSEWKSKVSRIWMTFQSFVDVFAEKIDSQVAEVCSVSRFRRIN